MFKNYKRTRKKEASEIVSQKRLYLGDGGVISEWYTTVENVSNIFPFVCPLGSCTVLLMDNGNAARVGSVPTGPLQYHDENRALLLRWLLDYSGSFIIKVHNELAGT